MVSELESSLIHTDTRATQNGRKRKSSLVTLLFAPADGSLIHVDSVGQNSSICVWSQTAREAKQCFDLLAARFGRRKRRLQESEFSVLVASDNAIESRSVRFRARTIDRVGLSLHYGTGFTEWDEQLQSALKKSQRGLTILRGEPGTGKTSYLRHLMWRLRSTHSFYYLPISAYSLIAAPAAVEFWIRQEANLPKRGKINSAILNGRPIPNVCFLCKMAICI